jgi:hypothetical protein
LKAAEDQLSAALSYAQKMGVTGNQTGNGARDAAASVAATGGGSGGGPGGPTAAVTGAANAANQNQAAQQSKNPTNGDPLHNKDGTDAAKPGSPSQKVETGLETAQATLTSLLEKVAGDANFANVAVLLGLSPGQLIQQAQQLNMLDKLSQTIVQLQSPFGNPVQEMQRFVEQLKARADGAVMPSDSTAGVV